MCRVGTTVELEVVDVLTLEELLEARVDELNARVLLELARVDEEDFDVLDRLELGFTEDELRELELELESLVDEELLELVIDEELLVLVERREEEVEVDSLELDVEEREDEELLELDVADEVRDEEELLREVVVETARLEELERTLDVDETLLLLEPSLYNSYLTS